MLFVCFAIGLYQLFAFIASVVERGYRIACAPVCIAIGLHLLFACFAIGLHLLFVCFAIVVGRDYDCTCSCCITSVRGYRVACVRAFIASVVGRGYRIAPVLCLHCYRIAYSRTCITSVRGYRIASIHAYITIGLLMLVLAMLV